MHLSVYSTVLIKQEAQLLQRDSASDIDSDMLNRLSMDQECDRRRDRRTDGRIKPYSAQAHFHQVDSVELSGVLNAPTQVNDTILCEGAYG